MTTSDKQKSAPKHPLTTSDKHKSSPKHPMTTSDAARIQSHAAKADGGKVEKGSFAARAQAAAAKNVVASQGEKQLHVSEYTYKSVKKLTLR